MSDFEKYYGNLARQGGRFVPRADEAKRDYIGALRQMLDGFLGR